jgi:hypothetical protein
MRRSALNGGGMQKEEEEQEFSMSFTFVFAETEGLLSIISERT